MDQFEIHWLRGGYGGIVVNTVASVGNTVAKLRIVAQLGYGGSSGDLVGSYV